MVFGKATNWRLTPRGGSVKWNIAPAAPLNVSVDIPSTDKEDTSMGRGILLWLLGVPIPVIILILLFWH